MPISQSNIPSVKNAIVELDLTGNGTFASAIAIQGQATQVSVSGGEYGTTSLAVLDGTVFTSTGEKDTYTIDVESVFTDGEASDLHPLLEAVHGDSNIGIRWAPAGSGSGKRRFKCVGSLFKLLPPSLNKNGDVLYSFGIRGDVNGEDIS